MCSGAQEEMWNVCMAMLPQNNNRVPTYRQFQYCIDRNGNLFNHSRTTFSHEVKYKTVLVNVQNFNIAEQLVNIVCKHPIQANAELYSAYADELEASFGASPATYKLLITLHVDSYAPFDNSSECLTICAAHVMNLSESVRFQSTFVFFFIVR